MNPEDIIRLMKAFMAGKKIMRKSVTKGPAEPITGAEKAGLWNFRDYEYFEFQEKPRFVNDNFPDLFR